MRQMLLIAFLATAACSPADDAQNAMGTATAGNATHPAKADASADQKVAVAAANAYLSHLGKGEYQEAHALWNDDGKASGGSVADLKRAYGIYTSFVGTAEEASPVSATSGIDRTVVAVQVRAVMKKTGAKRDLNGFVYLQRSAATKGTWRIWGVDIRRRG